jgi:DNA polymerase III subunit epsilon
MPLNLKNPLAFFDLETTGTRISHDRIVEIAILKVMPNGERLEFVKRINPEQPIPLEVSLIHGIYDDDVKNAPSFKMIAKELVKFLNGCDLAGFNILRFDIPMLIESFLRVEIDFKIAHRKVVDAQRIFHLMEKRNLKAAYEFYCHKELIGAHSAMVDTEATLAVLEAQVARYANQPVIDNLGRKLGVIENDVTKLHALTATPLLDFAGRMVYDVQGTVVFHFGKHKGKPVVQVLQQEPTYYDWIMKGDFTLDTKRKLTQIKLKAKEDSVL